MRTGVPRQHQKYMRYRLVPTTSYTNSSRQVYSVTTMTRDKNRATLKLYLRTNRTRTWSKPQNDQTHLLSVTALISHSLAPLTPEGCTLSRYHSVAPASRWHPAQTKTLTSVLTSLNSLPNHLIQVQVPQQSPPNTRVLNRLLAPCEVFLPRCLKSLNQLCSTTVYS